MKVIVGQWVLRLLSVYATQYGLSDSVKDLFYDQLRAVTAMIPASEFLIPCGDWNGHVGSTGSSYKEVHGGYGKPDPDSESERIQEYALAYDLFLCNTFQETWQSPHYIQVWLYSNPDRLRVISKEPEQTCNGCEGDSWRGGCSAASAPCVTPRSKVWKLRDPQMRSRFQEVFKAHVPAVETEAATST